MALDLSRTVETLPKQKRSRARRAAMIAYGVELLKDRDVEDVAIAEITGALGYSTGSFYSAFTDKSAFFIAVQREVNDVVCSWIEDEIETRDLDDVSLAHRLAICVDLTLRYFREYRGVMRSALRYEQKTPVAFGTMVNSMLHDPGPLRLHDEAFGREVIGALTPFLADTND